MGEGSIRLRSENGVGRIVIDNPARRNAMTAAMWSALPRLCDAIEADAACRVVLLVGDGEHFCAGADISEFDAVFATPQTARAYYDAGQTGMQRLAQLDRPVIACVQGQCVGGGVSLIAQCDLVFASAAATFAVTPSKLGLVYPHADCARLVERVGPAAARDLLFSGRRIDAATALALRLIDRVAEGDLAALVDGYVAELLAVSSHSVRTHKRLLRALRPDAEIGEAFARAFVEAAMGPDFAEGRAAFMAKRRPVFL